MWAIVAMQEEYGEHNMRLIGFRKSMKFKAGIWEILLFKTKIEENENWHFSKTKNRILKPKLL